MITASFKIAGSTRAVPDSASAPVLNSGASTKSNFQSVLDQFHTARESDSGTDETEVVPQQKDKEADPTRALIAALPLAQTLESPRAILPFTSSIKLRQVDAALQNQSEAVENHPEPAVENHPASELEFQDAIAVRSAAAVQNRPAAAVESDTTSDVQDRPAVEIATSPRETAPKSSQPAGSVRAVWAIASGSSRRAAEPLQSSSDLKMKSASRGKQEQKDSAPIQPEATNLTVMQTAEVSLPIRPFSYSTTAEPAAAIRIAGTIPTDRDVDSASAKPHDIRFQNRISGDRDSKTADIVSRQKRKDSELASTIAVPLAAMSTTEASHPIYPLTAPTTTRHDRTVLPSDSPVPQGSSFAPETNPGTVTLPTQECAENTTADRNAGELAFAARLTPTTELPSSRPEPIRTADPLPRSQTSLQPATPVTAKQVTPQADLPADAHSGEGGGQPDKEKSGDRLAKPETLLPQTHAAVADQTMLPANNHASTSPLSQTTHMDKVIDPPAAPSNTNRDITVRIPDSTDQGTAVRFVERAGEVHVSVRTGDVEMAQSLRGGLNDLMSHLEDGGIRTEVWQPGSGSNGASSQNDSHHPFADPDSSQGRQNSAGSDSQQDSRRQDRPRWVEQLESSIGNPTFKETTHLLWQA